MYTTFCVKFSLIDEEFKTKILFVIPVWRMLQYSIFFFLQAEPL